MSLRLLAGLAAVAAFAVTIQIATPAIAADGSAPSPPTGSSMGSTMGSSGQSGGGQGEPYIGILPLDDPGAAGGIGQAAGAGPQAAGAEAAPIVTYDRALFFWVPVVLPSRPGLSKISLGGVVPPDAPPPALTPLEEEKLAMARAAIDAARATASCQAGVVRDKGTPGTGIVLPLRPDPAAGLLLRIPPLQQSGPPVLNESEKAKCARAAERGGQQ